MIFKSATGHGWSLVLGKGHSNRGLNAQLVRRRAIQNKSNESAFFYTDRSLPIVTLFYLNLKSSRLEIGLEI